MTTQKEQTKCIDCDKLLPKTLHSQAKRCKKCAAIRKKMKEKEYRRNNKIKVKEQNKKDSRTHYLNNRGKLPAELTIIKNRLGIVEKKLNISHIQI